MTKQELEALIDARLTARLTGEGTIPSPWAEEELADAKRHGLTDASRPRGYTTREEAAVMVERLRKQLITE